MKCDRCDEAAILHVTEVVSQDSIENLHLCGDCANREFNEHPTPRIPDSTERGTPEKRDGGTRFDVARLIISEIHEEQVVVLREAGGERSFSIVIGIFEATALDRTLKRFSSPRPLTYDGWASTITALGGELQDVFIAEWHDSIYFARLRIRQPPPLDRLVEVDLRPSDAFILAIHHGVPIVVNDEVVAEVCE
jgi:bifunctional DNase/RNase